MAKSLSFREVMQGNVRVLTVSRVLWSVSDTIVMTYLSLYILELGGSKPAIGLINAAGGFAASLLYPLGGYIADKAGRARLVGLATVLYISSFLILALAPSWQWLAVGIVYQQGVLFYMPALNAIMADSIPIGARGRIYAFTVAVPNAARIVAPYLGGYLIAVYTLQPAMRLGYTLAFLIGMVVAFIRVRYLKETVKSEEKIGRNIPGILKESYSNVFSSLRWVFSNIRGFAVMAMLLAFIGNLVMPFWVVYAKEVIGLSAYDWGVVQLLGGITTTLASLVIGNLVDKLGTKKCMEISLGLAIPLMVLFTQASSFIQVIPIYLALVVSGAFLWITSSVFLADNIPRAMRGRVMAGLGQGVSTGVGGGGWASGFISFIPMSIGSFTSGYIYSINPAYPWLIQSVFLTVALLLSVLVIHDREKAEQ